MKNLSLHKTVWAAKSKWQCVLFSQDFFLNFLELFLKDVEGGIAEH